MNSFLPITTLFLSLAVVIIAALQWQIARNKLPLDLFDRRYKVYGATRRFLALIGRDAGFDHSHLFEFYAGTSDAEFLFGSDVLDYLKQIRKRALDMRPHRKILEGPRAGDENSRLVQLEHDQSSWLFDQLTTLTTLFAPYLGFAHIRKTFLSSAKQTVWRIIKPEN